MARDDERPDDNDSDRTGEPLLDKAVMAWDTCQSRVDRWLADVVLKDWRSALGYLLPALICAGSVVWVGERYGPEPAAGLTCVCLGGVLSWVSYRSRPLTWGVIIRTYVSMSVTFAGLYFLVYQESSGNYAFSEGIVSAAELEGLASARKQALGCYRRLELLDQLGFWMSSHSDTTARPFLGDRYVPQDGEGVGQKWVLPGSITVEHYVVSTQHLSIAHLSITDGAGTETWDDGPYKAVQRLVRDKGVGRREYLALLSEVEAKEAELLKSASIRLRALPSHRFRQADFLYFSIVTVTTLGYGDIVPNSTSVRMLVVLQILLGLALIVRGPGRTR